MRKNRYTREAQAVQPRVGRRHGPLMTRFFLFLSFYEKSKLMGGRLSGQVLEIYGKEKMSEIIFSLRVSGTIKLV